jgi:hypothetical protein
MTVANHRFSLLSFNFCFHDCKHENSQLGLPFGFEFLIKGKLLLWFTIELSYSFYEHDCSPCL